MKKLIALVLSIILFTGLAGCNDQQPAPQDATPNTTLTPAPDVASTAPDPSDAPEETSAPASTPAPGDETDPTRLVIDGTDLNANPLAQDVLMPDGLTFVNVWATFCTYCIEELPHLESISQEYAAKGEKVKVLGVLDDPVSLDGSIDQSLVELGLDILTQTGVTYENILPGEKLRDVFQYTVPGYPTSFIVDEDGNILRMIVGASTEDYIKDKIDELL
ncbi:MAG: redoxin family protein [Christensenellales bacterium]|jgi:thiol-disulfide isomerase/thioredoxin